MDWICSPGILPSPKDQSVLLREAILGAVDKLIFVYNLSQTIQMIGWFFISLCIQGNMKNWGLGIFAGSARRLAGPAECPGPRSSPTTAEWRVMRILYPSVSRHSPSSPPTFFILASHHTNSYGHKMEREGAGEVKWQREQCAGCPSGLPSLTFAVCPPPMIDNHADIILPAPLAPLYCPSHPKPTPWPPLPTTDTHTLRSLACLSHCGKKLVSGSSADVFAAQLLIKLGSLSSLRLKFFIQDVEETTMLVFRRWHQWSWRTSV